MAWGDDLAGGDDSDVNPYEIVITKDISVSAVFKAEQGLPAWAWVGIGIGVALGAVGLTYLRVLQRRRMRQTLLGARQAPAIESPPK